MRKVRKHLSCGLFPLIENEIDCDSSRYTAVWRQSNHRIGHKWNNTTTTIFTQKRKNTFPRTVQKPATGDASFFARRLPLVALATHAYHCPVIRHSDSQSKQDSQTFINYQIGRAHV